MTPVKRALAVPAALLAAGGILALGLPAASSQAATTTLCKLQTASVDGSRYTVENNEWGSSAPECITTDGGADFTVANSAIHNATNGAPGGYMAIYKGCHWGACTTGSGFPIRASDIHPGTVTTSWSTAQPGGSSDYDVAYDIWFNQTPTTSGQPNGTELMIWLNHNGPVQPFGSQVASDVSVGGRGYNVWFGQQGWNTVSYTMTAGTTSVSNLDLQAVVADAVKRGYIGNSWYLIDVEAGFEAWQGGAGLATKSFSVNAGGGGTPSPRPTPTHPRPTPTHPTPTPTHPTPTPTRPTPTPTTPSPGSATDISLAAISPNPTTPGTATNATVNFKNISSITASDVTLVTDVLNSAGTIVGSWSWTGQNVAPQQTLNETYTWTAARAGTYTVEGLVRDSSGKTLQQAPVGTITVK
jgi:cellulose 1,4-beta-cellobiosidase